MSGAGRAELFGVPIDRVDTAQAVERIGAWLREPRGPTRLVFTPNPEIVMAARGDESVRSLLCEADLAPPDGIGIVWAARTLGFPVPERVAGIDLMERLLALAAREGHPVYFLGTHPDVLEEAVARAVERYPGLSIAGTQHGYFRPDEGGAVADRVAASGARLLLVGMGAPREQRWLVTYRARLGVRVAMGVGGSFDVLAGRLRRAPRFLRSLHMEWLYRLVQEPRRLRRYGALPRFVVAVLRARRGWAARADG